MLANCDMEFEVYRGWMWAGEGKGILFLRRKIRFLMEGVFVRVFLG